MRFPFILQSLGDVFAVRFNGGKRVVGCFLLGFENFRSVFFIAIYERLRQFRLADIHFFGKVLVPLYREEERCREDCSDRPTYRPRPPYTRRAHRLV